LNTRFAIFKIGNSDLISTATGLNGFGVASENFGDFAYDFVDFAYYFVDCLKMGFFVSE
jgi:hypothetical protein